MEINKGFKLYFDEPSHTYTDQHGEIYTSVTTFLGKFHEKFEDYEEFWLLYKAVQYSSDIDKLGKINKYDKDLDERIGLCLFDARRCSELLKFGRWKCDRDVECFRRAFTDMELFDLDMACIKIKDHWKKENRMALEKGTAFHNWKEDLQYETGKYQYEGNFHFVVPKQEEKDLYNLDVGVHPELRMWNEEFKLAGTADQVIILPGRKALIRDWKGLALDTPLATPDGWTTMGEVEKGDLIFDGEGNPTKVIHTSEIHHNPCYKITFDTNEELIADHEHRWEVEIRDDNNFDRTHILDTLELKQLLEEDKAIKISTVGPEMSEKDLSIHPYVLGLWLADGNRTCGTITCDRQEIWDYIESLGYETSEDHNECNDKTESRTIYGLRTELRKLGLLGNKHIPVEYLRSSYSQKLELLRGLMDGDGHFNRKRKRNVMETTSLVQAEYGAELVASLGWKPTIIEATTSGFGLIDVPTYHLCFSSYENPFRNRNKDYREVMGYKSYYKSKNRYIKSIELVDTVPTRCLGVESACHTYLAGKGMIKTHNTNKEIKMSNKYQSMLPPVNHLDDCNYIHYNLQLSLYSYMLEQFGYDVCYLEVEHFDLGWDDDKKTWFKKGEDTLYPLPNLRKEIKDILNYGII